MKRTFFLAMILLTGFLHAATSQQGMTLYKEGKYAEAAQAFERALESDTSRKERRIIYLYMGKSYESSGRFDKAIHAYEQAADYDRRNWRRHRDLAGLYEQAELYQKAIECYTKALDLSPKQSAVYLALGRTWRKFGLNSYAETWLDKARATGEHLQSVYEEQSYVYEAQGRFLEAATTCSYTEGNGPRLVYLAALAGEPTLLTEGQRRLKGTALQHDTPQVYENLVQLLTLPPREILAGKTNNPTLQALFKTHLSEGK